MSSAGQASASAPSGKGLTPADKGLKLNAVAPRRAAYFDVDGTLTRTTIVTPLLWHLSKHLSYPLFVLWKCSLLLRGPYWLLLDRLSRDASNRAIYGCYAGMSLAELEQRSEACHRECIQPRLFAKGVERIRQLQKDGLDVVLVTGGLDFVLRPLARELKAALIAPSLCVVNGRCSGALNGSPLAGERKATALRAHAEANGIDLAKSLAFGDAFGDLQMLEAVGQPMAVNADTRLTKIALERNWPREDWRS